MVSSSGSTARRLHRLAVVAVVVSVAVALQGPATPGVGLSGQSRWGGVALASTHTPLATGTATAITVYKSVSITPAPGWTVAKQGDGFVELQNADKTVLLFAQAGAADAPDINQQATEFINAAIKAESLTDVQQEPVGILETIQGNNFLELMLVAYAGYIQSDQGSQVSPGIWAVLFNSVTKTAGFVNYFTPDLATGNQGFTGGATDFQSMLTSME
jgi:hypothetical protein